MENLTTPPVPTLESIDALQLRSVSGGCGQSCCQPAPLPPAQWPDPTDGQDSVVNSITITTGAGTTKRTV